MTVDGGHIPMPETLNRTRLFTGCVVALVATSFGFAVRAAILGQWRADFNLSQEQIGYLLGPVSFRLPSRSSCSA